MCGLGIVAFCSLHPGALGAPVWKPPVIPFRSSVRLEAGLEQTVDRAITRLSAPPYTESFILADVNFGQQRIFTEYSGDISGRMLSMIARERRFGLPDSWPLDHLLAGLAAAQQPDGHFGKPQDLAHEIVGDRDMPILWGNGRLLMGLVDVYAVSRDPRALDMARKLGDYYVATDAYLDRPELVHKFGNYAAGFATCYFSGIEGMVGLWRATRDGRYLAQARRMAHLMMQYTKPGEQHSHGRLCALRGLLDLYKATSDPAYLSYVTDEYRFTATHYLWPTGGLSEMTVPTFQRDEGCTEADWLRLSLELWRLTGKPQYLDDAEWTLRNEMAVNQFPNGGFGHHTARFAAGLMDGYEPNNDRTAQEAYWCCSEHCPRALLDAVSYAIVPRGTDVFLNLYEPMKTEFVVKGQPVSFEIAPAQGGEIVRIVISTHRPIRMALHLRRPAWCSSMTVDGRPEPENPEGRVVLSRQWRGTTSVEIRFGAVLRAWREGQPAFGVPVDQWDSHSDSLVALFLGPYLLGRDWDDLSDPPVVAVGGTLSNIGENMVLHGSDGKTWVFRSVAAITPKGSGFRIRVRLAATSH